MPADEETRGAAVGESRARSGPQHAAPKKPLLTWLNVPTGKAMVLAAMPTAVLMGMGFTPMLARADAKPSANELTVDEYKNCAAALKAAEEGREGPGTPSPSASPSAPAFGSGSSPDAGSDDKSAPAPFPSTRVSAGLTEEDATATPSPFSSGGNAPDTLGDDMDADATAVPAEANPTETTEGAYDPAEDTEDKTTGTAGDAKDTLDDPAKNTAQDVTDAVSEAAADIGDKITGTAGEVRNSLRNTAPDVTDLVGDASGDTGEKAKEEADEPTPSPVPSPSASSTTDPEDCPAATDDEGGIERGIPLLPDDPWYLEASSLLLKGADYQGIVKVRTAGGSVKEVLKYVVSDGTDITDLHRIVKDEQAGVTHHLQAGEGTTSTIRDGQTVMYTEGISGNLLGSIPVTFDPEHPPPVNMPLLYFTDVRVTQAAQFGGRLTVPGVRQYITD